MHGCLENPSGTNMYQTKNCFCKIDTITNHIISIYRVGKQNLQTWLAVDLQPCVFCFLCKTFYDQTTKLQNRIIAYCLCCLLKQIDSIQDSDYWFDRLLMPVQILLPNPVHYIVLPKF